MRQGFFYRPDINQTYNYKSLNENILFSQSEASVQTSINCSLHQFPSACDSPLPTPAILTICRHKKEASAPQASPGIVRSHLSTSSVSLLWMACRRLITSMAPSETVRVLRAHGMCETVLQAICKSIIISELRPVLGPDLLPRLIDSESTQSSAASAAGCVLLTLRHSKNCSEHLTSSSSAKSSTTSTACYTTTFHLLCQQPHRTTTCDLAHTIDNYPPILATSQTQTFFTHLLYNDIY